MPAATAATVRARTWPTAEPSETPMPDIPMTPDSPAPYTAYSYLPPGSFPEFELTPEFSRVLAYTGAKLTPEQAARSRSMLRDSLVTSPHDDPVRVPQGIEP